MKLQYLLIILAATTYAAEKETSIVPEELQPAIHKNIKDMSYAELKTAKEKAITNNDMTLALKYAHKMEPLCDNMVELGDLKFEIASLYMRLGKLDKAQTMYREFSKLYPGTEKVEEALYQEANCCFLTMLACENDQSRTRDTIDLAQEFLKKPEFGKYTKEVESILAKSRDVLFESEIKIAEFYIGRSKFKSASKRLENIRKEFLAVLPASEARILELEYTIAQLQDNQELATTKRSELMAKFPEQEQKLALAEKPVKRHAANRF